MKNEYIQNLQVIGKECMSLVTCLNSKNVSKKKKLEKLKTFYKEAGKIIYEDFEEIFIKKVEMKITNTNEDVIKSDNAKVIN